MIRRGIPGWLFVVMALQCGRATAQTATIEPDRPDVTNGPHLVSAGTVQFELGGIFTRDRGDRMAAAPATVRIGVSKAFEARFGVDNQFVATGDDQAGIGSVQAGAKVRVWSDSNGVALLSILPTVYVPTGGGDPEVWVVAATGADFGPRTRLDVNYGATSHASEAEARLFQQLLTASVSISMASRWNGYLELYGTSRERKDGAAAIGFDTGVQYFIAPHVAADAGVDVGVSGDSPSFSVFGGLSFALRRRGRATSASRARGRD
jgi:hypothetical protein